MIAISTAYKKALVAIEIDGKVAMRELDSNCKHSENILPAIDEALEEICASLKDNDCYGVVLGPGSFTGVRIASALVKGFIAGDGKKAVAVTTFDLIAYNYVKNYKPNENFTTIINGLSGYYFICQHHSTGKALGEGQMVTERELKSINSTLVGLQEEGIGEILVEPTSTDLLEICLASKEVKGFVEASTLSPIYLRKSQAEVSLEEKEKILKK